MSSDDSSDEEILNQILDADNDTLHDLKQDDQLARFDPGEISTFKVLCDALGTVTSVKELETWLKSPQFRPHFMQCYLNSVLPGHASVENMSRSDSFTTITRRSTSLQTVET